MLRIFQKFVSRAVLAQKLLSPVKILSVRCFAKEDEYDKGMIKKYRYLQANRSPDINTFKKQLLFRSAHMGMKELELITSKYLQHNIDNMSYEDLVKFEEEVLLQDNMLLFNHILGNKQIKNLPKDCYIEKIKDFALKEKVLPDKE